MEDRGEWGWGSGRGGVGGEGGVRREGGGEVEREMRGEGRGEEEVEKEEGGVSQLCCFAHKANKSGTTSNAKSC